MLPMLVSPGVFLLGVVTFAIVLWDAFEAIILPRRVTRKFRLTRYYYRLTWTLWKTVVSFTPNRKTRETLLGYYGPISLLALVGVWAVGLVLSFGMMQYGAGSAINIAGSKPPSIWTDFYLSGTTFFTLGLGDVVPRSALARLLVVAEAGFGFAFLAAIIGYLPFIYGSFSTREVNIVLLDSRAGTPPTAGELLRRHSYKTGPDDLKLLLKDWERWSAQLLESHLSYPVLAYFRSQHDNQSWISSLTAILDTCALLISGRESACNKQAELTFAIARHAMVDLSQVFHARPIAPPKDRLPEDELKHLRETLAQSGMQLNASAEATHRLQEIRQMYEPYAYALGVHLSQALPPWLPAGQRKDNWQTTAWAQTSGSVAREQASLVHDDHL